MRLPWAPIPPTPPAKDLKIDCNGTPPGASDCEKKQICAKIEKVNQQAKAGKLRRPKRSKLQKKIARRRGNSAAETFKDRLGASLLGKGKNGRILKRWISRKLPHEVVSRRGAVGRGVLPC